MSSGALIAVGVAVLVVLAVVLLAGAARRRDTGEAIGALSRETRKRDRGVGPLAGEQAVAGAEEAPRGVALERRQASTAITPATAATPAPWVPPDPEAIGVSRRQFLNRGIVGVTGFSLTVFGVSIVGFLWPQSSGGFGSKIRVGSISDIKAGITAGNGFFYYPEGRMWITEYPASALEKARGVYSQPVLNSMEVGLAVLYQKCVHLGCRVPECETSQWFECPCHGSQYNQAGERKGGPAPRGLDRFATEIDGDALIVDTGQIIQGPPIGTNTTGQESEGPHCIGATEGH